MASAILAVLGAFAWTASSSHLTIRRVWDGARGVSALPPMPQRRQLATAQHRWAQTVTTHVSGYYGIASSFETVGSREWVRPAPVWGHAMVVLAPDNFHATHSARARQTLVLIGGQARSVSGSVAKITLGVLGSGADSATLVDAAGACDLRVDATTVCLRWKAAVRTAMPPRYFHTSVHMSRGDDRPGVVVTYGGTDGRKMLSDLWTAPAGDAPATSTACPAVRLLSARPRLNAAPSDLNTTVAAPCRGHVALLVGVGVDAVVDTGVPAAGQRCSWSIRVDPASAAAAAAAAASGGSIILTFERFDVGAALGVRTPPCKTQSLKMVDASGSATTLCTSNLRCATYASERWDLAWEYDATCASHAGVRIVATHSDAAPCSRQGACSGAHGRCSGGACCCDAGWAGAVCATPCDSFACAVGHREIASDALAGTPRLALLHPGYRQQHSAVAVQHETNATISFACKTACPTLVGSAWTYGGTESCLVYLRRGAFARIGAAAPLKSVNPHCSAAAACCDGTSSASIGASAATADADDDPFTDYTFTTTWSSTVGGDVTITVVASARTSGTLRMVVFGGWNSAPSAALWEFVLREVPSTSFNASVDWELTPTFPYPLIGASRWTSLAASASAAAVAPAARYGHSAVVMGRYGSGGASADAYRMVVFAGRSSSGLLSDVWSYALEGDGGWTRVAISAGTAAPAARYLHTSTVVVDSATGLKTMLVFGGSDELTVRGDLWKLTQATSPSSGAWIEVTETRGSWLDCRARMPPASLFGIACSTIDDAQLPLRYLHTAVPITTSVGAAAPDGTGLLVYGGVDALVTPNGANFDRNANFGGGKYPDMFVICIDGDTSYCDVPRILGRAAGWRRLNSVLLLLLAFLIVSLL